MPNLFVQISTLTGYSGVLLNRDQSGMSKKLEYGGAERTRISSQFAKRKLRLAEGVHSIKGSVGEEAKVGVSMRSRYVVSHGIAAPLYDAYPKELVIEGALALMDALYEPSKKALADRVKLQARIDKGEADPTEVLHRNELVIFGRPEIEYLRRLVAEAVEGKTDKASVRNAVVERTSDKTFKANLKEVGRKSPSLDVAMFGRMVTGDALSAMDAAVHVAHGISVHKQAANLDFFTAVDDLVGQVEASSADDAQTAGTAHMGDTEVTSPLLYNYYVVDVGQLNDNLAGLDNREEVVSHLVEQLIHLVCTSIVGAKKGSTAPYSTADFLLVEVGSDPCASLAGAFRKPVVGDLEGAVAALGRYMAGKDGMYGTSAKRWFAHGVDAGIPNSEHRTVAEVAKAAGEAVRSAG